jgi:HSP20 family protein
MANRDLTPWRRHGAEPFMRDPFGSFRREMDRLFDDFFAPAEARSFAPATQAARGMIMPSLDVDESDEAYMVTAELPGIDQKDIELSLDDNVLTLRGEKRLERNEREAGRHYTERSYGRFERSIPFAAEIDADRVQANCENGVLTIVLPKNPRARETSRRIEIRGDGASAAGGQSQVGQGRSAQGRGPQAQTDQPPPQAGMEGSGYRPSGDV